MQEMTAYQFSVCNCLSFWRMQEMTAYQFSVCNCLSFWRMSCLSFRRIKNFKRLNPLYPSANLYLSKRMN